MPLTGGTKLPLNWAAHNKQAAQHAACTNCNKTVMAVVLQTVVLLRSEACGHNRQCRQLVEDVNVALEIRRASHLNEHDGVK